MKKIIALEERIFDKHIVNQSMKVYFHLIEELFIQNISYQKKDKKLECYISNLDKIYQNSFIENESLLNKKNIEKYSILKEYKNIKFDLIINSIIKKSFNEEIEIRNILTNEKIKMTASNKKIILNLFKIIINTPLKKSSFDKQIIFTK